MPFAGLNPRPTNYKLSALDQYTSEVVDSRVKGSEEEQGASPNRVHLSALQSGATGHNSIHGLHVRVRWIIHRLLAIIYTFLDNRRNFQPVILVSWILYNSIFLFLDVHFLSPLCKLNLCILCALVKCLLCWHSVRFIMYHHYREWAITTLVVSLVVH